MALRPLQQRLTAIKSKQNNLTVLRCAALLVSSLHQALNRGTRKRVLRRKGGQAFVKFWQDTAHALGVGGRAVS